MKRIALTLVSLLVALHGSAKSLPASDATYLFATATCPKCKMIAARLDKAGIPYQKLIAEENPEAVKTIIYSKLSNYSFQDLLNFIRFLHPIFIDKRFGSFYNYHTTL